MDYEWDARKAVENLSKHGVDFSDAVIALEDENALTIEDRDAIELRFKYVIHAERGTDCIRIISARRATRHEVKQYYQGLNDYD